jgi:hypothetical protein
MDWVTKLSSQIQSRFILVNKIFFIQIMKSNDLSFGYFQIQLVRCSVMEPSPADEGMLQGFRLRGKCQGSTKT